MDVHLHPQLKHGSPTPAIALPLPYTALLETTTFHLLALATTFLLPLLTLLYIHADYKAFLSLGPGGTPSTPLGYLKIKLLSVLTLRDPLRPQHIPPHFRPQHGYLSASASASPNTTTLPARPGPRPTVQGIAPQRQQTQKSTPATYTALVSAMRNLISQPANCLVERTSCFEKHSSGIFTRSPITRTCGGEICHAHPSDGSLHMTLHPADAKIVLERGWGERHPLARGGWCRRFVPKEFVLVYAPRSGEEVEVVMRIVKAGVWWVAGIDVEKEGLERRDEGAEGRVDEGGCRACRAHGCGSKGLEGSMAGSV